MRKIYYLPVLVDLKNKTVYLEVSESVLKSEIAEHFAEFISEDYTPVITSTAFRNIR